MKHTTRIKIDRDYRIGPVQDRVFSSFVEHMGSCVYNGIYQPGHPSEDERGFRGDVLSLVRQLKLPAIRYPGGNFTSGYRWEDTVGPERPVRLDYAWQQTEPNTFGLHEFFQWLGAAGSEAIMTVNLGTRGPESASQLLEYMNYAGQSHYSDLRRKNGRERPFGVKTWCLGNELDAPWQICHKSAEEYGRIAAETARLMRAFDPSLELVAVGSSHNRMPTFPEWDRKMLMECYEDVDYLALHKYVIHDGLDTPSYLAAPMEMERQIRDIIATCDYVRSVGRSQKTMKLAFDEWNVVGLEADGSVPSESWQIGPNRAKKQYTLEDALAFGSMLLTLLRHADRVQIACQAILVNVLPLICADPGGCYASTIYYPFLHGSQYGRGISMGCLVDTPQYDCAAYTDVPVVDCAAVFEEATGMLHIFAVNRSPAPQPLQIDPVGFGSLEQASHITMTGDLLAANTPDHPRACVPQEAVDLGDRSSCVLPGYSWNVIRMQMKGE